jgi:hypothetical protein
VVDQPKVLGGDPGSSELLVVGIAGVESGQQLGPGVVAVVVGGAAQQPADAIERIVSAPAVAGLLAWDAAADLVDGGEPQAYDVKGI